ncbi:MAG: 4Fe-4S dicluster domain-containing protein [Eggerthellaceae bacterium]|nr:4Fe-4S dicluster domain-containing protein [Eggerthellaceae bacterium]
MTQYAIVTDLNQCVGCLACSVSCKVLNDVPIGSYWNKVLRIGPNLRTDTSEFPDVELYFLPVSCQHCEDPACVEVCPTGASAKQENGTVQIDKSKCIGCQFCVMSCPYGVRYLNEDEGVVEKCTLCEQQVEQGGLPQCVAQCGGRARYFGDLDEGLDSFEGPAPVDISTGNVSYQDVRTSRAKLLDAVKDFSDSDIHHLPNVGNNPSFMYILRNRTWRGEE